MGAAQLVIEVRDPIKSLVTGTSFLVNCHAITKECAYFYFIYALIGFINYETTCLNEQPLP